MAFDGAERPFVIFGEEVSTGGEVRLPTAWTLAPIEEHLRALASLADSLREQIPPDRGGRANIETEQYGNPKGWLALEAFRVYIAYRPADVEPVDGPLLDFGAALLAWASDGREEGESIRPYLQRIVAWVRWYDARHARFVPQESLDTLRTAVAAADSREARMAAHSVLHHQLQRTLDWIPTTQLLLFNPSDVIDDTELYPPDSSGG